MQTSAVEGDVAPRARDGDVATLIQSVFDTLHGLASDEASESEDLTPAVSIRRSVTDDHIICLERKPAPAAPEPKPKRSRKPAA